MKDTCLFCQGQEIFPYVSGVRDQRLIVTKRHGFVKCQQCGSLRLVPLPTQRDLEKSYPQEYQFKKESKNRLRNLWNLLEWRIFYEPVLRSSVLGIEQNTGLRAGSVLDIGCGNGLLLQQLVQAGYEAEGLDLPSAGLRYAKQVLGLNVREANIEEIDLPSSRYHLISAYCVLEHLVNPAALITKMKKGLIPGGWGIWKVPQADSWVAFLFRKFWAQIREAPRHVTIPTAQGMFIILERNGFKNFKSQPAPALELAADVALSLWPRGNYFRTTGSRPILNIIDRLCVGLLTITAILPTLLLKGLGVKQGFAIFFAQKIDSGTDG